jgi:hypothetical protein
METVIALAPVFSVILFGITMCLYRINARVQRIEEVLTPLSPLILAAPPRQDLEWETPPRTV